jgi:hypothetical protein
MAAKSLPVRAGDPPSTAPNTFGICQHSIMYMSAAPMTSKAVIDGYVAVPTPRAQPTPSDCPALIKQLSRAISTRDNCVRDHDDQRRKYQRERRSGLVKKADVLPPSIKAAAIPMPCSNTSPGERGPVAVYSRLGASRQTIRSVPADDLKLSMTAGIQMRP